MSETTTIGFAIPYCDPELDDHRLLALIAESTAALAAGGPFEPYLGVPDGDGYVLSSTMAGVRSWIVAGGGSGSIPIGNTLFVDAVNGNDATGLRGRLDKPFLTLTAAQTTAVIGDLIYVREGTYNNVGLLGKDQVDWWFDAGAVIIGVNGTQLWVSGAADVPGQNSVGFSVTGHAVFQVTNDDFDFGIQVIGFGSSNTAAPIFFECDSVIGLSTNGQGVVAVSSYNPNLTFRAKKVYSQNNRAIEWFYTEAHFHVENVFGTVVSGTGGGPHSDGDFYVYIDNLQGDFVESGNDPLTAAWVTIGTIHGNISLSGVTRVYLSVQKLFGNITNSGTGLLYYDGFKVASTGSELLTISNGTNRIEITHLDPNANNVGLGTISGGTTELIGGAFVSTAGGTGIAHTAGTLRLSTRINVSAAAGASAVSLTVAGAPVLILESACKLISNGATNPVVTDGVITIDSLASGSAALGAGVTVRTGGSFAVIPGGL